eukprot:391326_1
MIQKNYKIWSNIAACYVKSAQWDSAIEACDKCLAIQPHFIKALIRKGQCYHGMRLYHKALRCYRQAEQMDEKYKTLYMNATLSEAKQKTLIAIQGLQAAPNTPDDAFNRETRERVMRDPEIQQIMNNPEFEISNIASSTKR